MTNQLRDIVSCGVQGVRRKSVRSISPADSLEATPAQVFVSARHLVQRASSKTNKMSQRRALSPMLSRTGGAETAWHTAGCLRELAALGRRAATRTGEAMLAWRTAPRCMRDTVGAWLAASMTSGLFAAKMRRCKLATRELVQLLPCCALWGAPPPRPRAGGGSRAPTQLGDLGETRRSFAAMP